MTTGKRYFGIQMEEEQKPVSVQNESVVNNLLVLALGVLLGGALVLGIRDVYLPEPDYRDALWNFLIMLGGFLGVAFGAALSAQTVMRSIRAQHAHDEDREITKNENERKQLALTLATEVYNLSSSIHVERFTRKTVRESVETLQSMKNGEAAHGQGPPEFAGPLYLINKLETPIYDTLAPKIGLLGNEAALSLALFYSQVKGRKEYSETTVIKEIDGTEYLMLESADFLDDSALNAARYTYSRLAKISGFDGELRFVSSDDEVRELLESTFPRGKKSD